MAAPVINVADEYDAAPMDGEQASQPPAQQEVDIEVSAEQMAAMQQLAAAGSFEELGRMVAPLLTQPTA